MASDPTVTRDVRPVVAGGLCLVAVILAWPLFRHRAGDVGDSVQSDDRTTRRATLAEASPSTARPAPSAMPSTVRDASSDAVARTGPTPASARRPPAPSVPVGAAATGSAEPRQKSGIAVFPPPGTDPPKAGIIVPDDYELPPGYVRHYQTTDDGKQLPPILMFHPDFQPVDDRGRPIPLPADRVVPPEMAPPGMPHDVLQVPPTHVPFVEDPTR